MTTLDGITKAVERAVRCSVTHLRSTPVVETIGGQVVWEGVVEEFSVWLPPPKIVFAWALNDESEPRYVTVDATENIKTPLDAVRLWIEGQSRK